MGVCVCVCMMARLTHSTSAPEFQILVIRGDEGIFIELLHRLLLLRVQNACAISAASTRHVPLSVYVNIYMDIYKCNYVQRRISVRFSSFTSMVHCLRPSYQTVINLHIKLFFFTSEIARSMVKPIALYAARGRK